MKAIINLFKRKPKHPCALCGRDASTDYAEIGFQGVDEHTGEYETVVDRICKACADKLDSKEANYTELDDMVDWDRLEDELAEMEESLERKS